MHDEGDTAAGRIRTPDLLKKYLRATPRPAQDQSFLLELQHGAPYGGTVDAESLRQSTFRRQMRRRLLPDLGLQLIRDSFVL